MPANFIKLESIEQLDAIFDKSGPHRWFCSNTATARTSFDILEQAQEIDGDIYLLIVRKIGTVRTRRELTGHRHHSPQAFVIKGGRVAYHATHYGINPETIQTIAER